MRKLCPTKYTRFWWIEYSVALKKGRNNRGLDSIGRGQHPQWLAACAATDSSCFCEQQQPFNDLQQLQQLLRRNVMVFARTRWFWVGFKALSREACLISRVVFVTTRIQHPSRMWWRARRFVGAACLPVPSRIGWFAYGARYLCTIFFDFEKISDLPAHAFSERSQRPSTMCAEAVEAASVTEVSWKWLEHNLRTHFISIVRRAVDEVERKGNVCVYAFVWLCVYPVQNFAGCYQSIEFKHPEKKAPLETCPIALGLKWTLALFRVSGPSVMLQRRCLPPLCAQSLRNTHVQSNDMKRKNKPQQTSPNKQAHAAKQAWPNTKQACVIHMCGMTHSYVRHDSFICVIYRTCACDNFHSHLRHGSSICNAHADSSICNAQAQSGACGGGGL